MTFEIEELEGPLAVAKVSGRLDTLTAPDFSEQALAAIDAGHTRLVFDLSQVEYVSSAGLKAFLTAAKHADARGGAVALCALREPVERVFRVAGFDAFLDLCATSEEAAERTAPQD
jgi:anti-anti-sigma factor